MDKIQREKRKGILEFRLLGMTYAAIGKELGISRQRVQQLISPSKYIRNVVVKRANNRCQRCEVILDGSGHIHHKGNEDEDYNDIDNLELLCISCHRIAHSIYHPCPQCGRDIPQGRGHIFCCAQCRHDFSYKKIPCEVCGQLKEYHIKRVDWLQKRGGQKHFYCSKRCQGKWLGTNYGGGSTKQMINKIKRGHRTLRG